MGIRNNFSKNISRINNHLKFLLAKKNFELPIVFIIGCGRSGTSILGKSIGAHSEVCYLHEPKYIWQKGFPEMDVWTGNYHGPQHLKMDEQNFNSRAAGKVIAGFKKKLILSKKQIIVEKLPINSFRLDLLDSIFPNAKYIFLQRNGLEVTKSITRLNINENWYGKGDLKLKLLIELAKENNEINKLLEKVHKKIDHAMFEWRMSMEYSLEFFRKLNSDKFITLTYSDFVKDSNKELLKIFKFIGIDASINPDDFMKTKIRYRNTDKIDIEINELELENLKVIGGDMLDKSINNIIVR